MIPCEVRGAGKLVDGTVRNISAGGLSVQVDLAVEQGEILTLTLRPDRRRSIEVQGIVWHERRGVVKSTGKVVQRLGLVLAHAPEAFSELLPPQRSTAPRPRSKPRSVAEPEPSAVTAKAASVEKCPADSAPKPAPKAERYRVRVKQDSSPRTRSILVFAKDDDAARECAREETGAGWYILDLDRA